MDSHNKMKFISIKSFISKIHRRINTIHLQLTLRKKVGRGFQENDARTTPTTDKQVKAEIKTYQIFSLATDCSTRV